MPDSVLCFPPFMVHLDFCFFYGLGLAEKSFVLLHTRPLCIDLQGMRLLISYDTFSIFCFRFWF